MIRRLIRWLARAEIAKARDAGFEADCLAQKFLAEAQAKVHCELAYAKGEQAGMERAFEAVEAEVGPLRKVEPEDVIRARKRRAH